MLPGTLRSRSEFEGLVFRVFGLGYLIGCCSGVLKGTVVHRSAYRVEGWYPSDGVCKLGRMDLPVMLLCKLVGVIKLESSMGIHAQNQLRAL